MNELRVRIPSVLMHCGEMVTQNTENVFSILKYLLNEGIGVMVTHVAFVSFDTYNIIMR